MAQKVSKSTVLLYVPNVIGFIRIFLAFCAILCMSMDDWHVEATVLYALSCFLDAIDGTAARRFNQCTTRTHISICTCKIGCFIYCCCCKGSMFGAVLDMVTDRSTSSMLLCTLCVEYGSSLAPIFQTILALDLSSHYMHMVRQVAHLCTIKHTNMHCKCVA